MLTKIATLMALMAVTADAKKSKPVKAGRDEKGTDGIDIVALDCDITSSDTTITDPSVD